MWQIMVPEEEEVAPLLLCRCCGANIEAIEDVQLGVCPWCKTRHVWTF